MFETINRKRLERAMSYYFRGNKKSQHKNDRLDRKFGTLFSKKIKYSVFYGTNDPIPGSLKKLDKKSVKFDVYKFVRKHTPANDNIITL